MANEAVLRKYLMSIGFKIDEEGFRKFKENQEDLDKRNKELSDRFKKMAEIAGAAAVALGTAVIAITNKLNALYYSSELAESSAQNLEAFREAAEQIGISSEQATQLVTTFAQRLRDMPGLQGLAQSMGIDVTQDKVKVMLELIDKLHTKFPMFAQRAAILQQFGIDSTTLKLIEDHRDELQKYIEQYTKLGGQTNQQTAAARRFHQELKDLEIRFGKLWDIIATRLLPVGEVLIKWLSQAIDLLIAADKATDGWSSRIFGVVSAITSVIGSVKGLQTLMRLLGIGGTEAAGEAGVAAGGGALGSAAVGGAGVGAGVAGIGLVSFLSSPTWQKGLSDKVLSGKGNAFQNWFYEMMYGSKMEGGPVDAISKTNTTKERIDKKLEKVSGYVDEAADKYGLDKNLFRSLIYQESRGNPNALSKAGAIGLAQLMPSTARALGVNPRDPRQNAEGGAHFLHDLLMRYGGDTFLALQAYNAGPGAVAKYHGHVPFAETVDYLQKILGFRNILDSGGKTVTVHQNPKVDIHVNGSGDPKEVADRVLEGQKRVNAQMQRDGQGVIR